MPRAYYNEIDPFAASWLRKLIEARLIAAGEVDERSITEIQLEDLQGFGQCHFFAGIGVWSYSLRAAGWPDDTPVWTGSCPCQSFSASGKRAGFSDRRHLWPAWFRLIRELHPDTIFGEQVASKDGLAWLDLISADLERADYAIGSADLCAAGFGAPHIRQRLYFVGDAAKCRGRPQHGESKSSGGQKITFGGSGFSDQLGDAARRGLGMCGGASGECGWIAQPSESGSTVADSKLRHNGKEVSPRAGRWRSTELGLRGLTNGFWTGAEWLWCRDQKYRAVEPGTFPLVTGAPNRVGRLRGYGNALCAEVAKHFIESYLEIK